MQSSQVLHALPVVVSLLGPLAAPHAATAQSRFRVLNDNEWFYQLPEGKRLARIAVAAELAGGEGAAQGDWQAVILEGWIFAPSVGPSPKGGDSLDVAVTQAPEENLRATPGGTMIAKLPQGFLLSKLGEDNRWVHVQRAGWMKRGALQPMGEVAITPGRRPGVNTPKADSTARTDSAPPADPTRAASARRTTLYRAPEGPEAGSLATSTPLRVVSRSGEWTRVQLEGWVKTADLTNAAPGALVGISAAELRTDPDRYVGQTLRWTLQYIAVQKADELRPEIPAGASYLLARGPLPERGFVYVVVPDAKQSLVAGLTPLSVIQVTARVRAGRSHYLGNPVVDLISLEGGPTP